MTVELINAPSLTFKRIGTCPEAHDVNYVALNGISQLDIAAVLDHRALQMVKRYAHLSEGHTRGVLEDMVDKIRL